MNDPEHVDPLERGHWQSLDEQRAALAEMMGLDEPVSEHILLTALENETYARQLLASRNAPLWRDYLLAHPPEEEGKDKTGAEGEPANGATSPSNLQLIGRVSRALLRWGRSGFTTATPEMLARRERACLACPHLRDPDKTLQRLALPKNQQGTLGERTGNKVCGLCGCGVRNKMRMPTESCPDRHPDYEGYSRWGEELGNDQ